MKTALELQELFESKFRTLDKSGRQKPFTTSDIERFLNEALFRYFSEISNIADLNEDNKKRLYYYIRRKAILKSTLAPDNPLGDLFFIVDIPQNRIIEENVTISGRDYYIKKIKPITHDYYWANKDNKYKKPSNEMWWRLNRSFDDNGTIKNMAEIVSNGSVPTGDTYYRFTYIEKPEEISITSNNSLYLGDKDIFNIIDMAVMSAAKSIGVQTQ